MDPFGEQKRPHTLFPGTYFMIEKKMLQGQTYVGNPYQTRKKQTLQRL